MEVIKNITVPSKFMQGNGYSIDGDLKLSDFMGVHRIIICLPYIPDWRLNEIFEPIYGFLEGSDGTNKTASETKIT